MLSPMRLLSTLSALSLTASAMVLPREAAAKSSGQRALYFLDNDPSGNTIVAMSISTQNGVLSSLVRTVTGGFGSLGLGATGLPGTADTLYSQNSVLVSGTYLFTVNAGSNTLSMFTIPANDPLHPKLVGQPIDTLGDFPSSVTYSDKLQTACVLNGGARGGVACFNVNGAKGLTHLDTQARSLSPGLNETTPPVGPANTASDIIFSPSSESLVAVIKGNGGTNVPGFMYAWPVAKGKVSTTPVITQLSGVIMNFGSNFIGSDSTILVSDPTHGASILSIASNLEMTETSHILLPGFVAPCWSAYSSSLNAGFIIDAGETLIAIINPTDGSVSNTIQYNSTALGGFDTVPDRQYLYVLAKTAAIVVIDLVPALNGASPQQIQQFDLTSLGARSGYIGLAVYPSS